jgi:pyruvate,water dikinase
MTDLLRLDQIGPADLDAVGGKGLSLGLLTAAGLPVPPGFCLTTAVHRRLRGRSPADDDGLRQHVGAAYQDLGGGLLAVRSSATAEDGAAHSFAGQQDTLLGVSGEEGLLRAVADCWASLDTERARAYRQHHRVDEKSLAMAVVVQRLVPAESAGVLFTRDPLDPAGRRMLVEASWGLGETVVSGRVTPDRFHLDRDTGQVVSRHVAVKAVQRTAGGEEAVPEDRQTAPCLGDEQLAALAELGRRVEAFYKEPRDIEWAFAEGQFWLLQARPITAAETGERAQVRREEIARLAALADPAGTVWARFNLSEILPAPTPMSWAVVRRFMSGAGGFGRMYRDLGFDPDPALDEQGIFDLVCGRPYCNLSREPRLHDRYVPFEHPFARLKADPRRALYPSPGINAARFAWWFWLGLPVTLPWLTLRMTRGALRRQRLAKTFASRFREEIAPAFRREAEAASAQDLAQLDDGGLLRFFSHWDERTLVDFARDSLKPTALAALGMASLEQKLAVVLGAERARALAGELVMGVPPEPGADVAGAFRELAAGTLSPEAFLARFGHRGPGEMELASPRWGEEPGLLSWPTNAPAGRQPTASPADRLAAEPKLTAAQRSLLLGEVAALHDYLALRESAKHHLMLGYALLRRALLEVDRRGRLGGGVFYLTPDELPGLLAGEDHSVRIAERRKRRALLLALEAPAVLFSDDLEAIGRAVPAAEGECLRGAAISAGVAEGPALVLEHPHAAGATPEGYVLVCPQTDPAWVPLFVRARGLVMETGGVLSHGAIVAREFGLPGVAGLPGVMRRVRTGQRLRVDGTQGTVTLL